MLNDYNKIAEKYQETDEKPDKKFSILPTVLSLAGNLENKIVIDLGCGDGFFAREFAAKSPSKIIGLDNSEQQIKLARLKGGDIEYILCDIFKNPLPKSDIICAPFILNYAPNTNSLRDAFENIYNSLNPNGLFIGVMDLPEDQDLIKFGARKKIIGPHTDGTPIEIELFKNNELICVLNAYYYTKGTITSLLKSIGFKNIEWHKPIISEEGIELFGTDFWKYYPENCELGYFTAHKQ